MEFKINDDNTATLTASLEDMKLLFITMEKLLNLYLELREALASKP